MSTYFKILFIKILDPSEDLGKMKGLEQKETESIKWIKLN